MCNMVTDVFPTAITTSTTFTTSITTPDTATPMLVVVIVASTLGSAALGVILVTFVAMVCAAVLIKNGKRRKQLKVNGN